MRTLHTTTATMSKDLAAVFTKPAYSKEWATVEMITVARQRLLDNKVAMKALETKANDVVKYATEYFLYSLNDASTVASLNKLHALDTHLQVVVGQLALKLKVAKNPLLNTHENELVRSNLAFTILTLLADTGAIIRYNKDVPEVDEDTGRKSWRTVQFITLGYAADVNPYYVKGIHLEPTVVQKDTKVRVGGRSVKLSGKEKLFLKNAGSTPLRLIDINPEELTAYAKQSEWYLQVLSGKVNMDKIIANNLIKVQVEKFSRLQKLECFYLSIWMDYRTRLYYDMSEMLFNPHGKTFETSLLELAYPQLINEEGFKALAYSAVAIVDGRTAHTVAINKFIDNKEHYLAELRTQSSDMGKSLYNSRLAQAIEDYYNEIPSHFLLGEDATNGGLQHGGIGFKAPKMMVASNVGASDKQEDSHGWLQQYLGLATRDEAKDIHQPLLHGSSLRTIASMINKTIAETQVMLSETYGNEVHNISAIADWGTNVVDNFNTTLQWTTSDGFKAQSIAYVESVPLELYSLSLTNTSGYTKTKVHKDMPIVLNSKGEQVYGSVGNDKTMGGANKVRGLYANITHSIDATGLRTVIRTVKHANNNPAAGGVWKHDNFLVHPNDMMHVRKGYHTALLAEFDNSLYDAAIEGIRSNFDGQTPPALPLLKGTATRDMVEQSKYFLAC